MYEDGIIEDLGFTSAAIAASGGTSLVYHLSFKVSQIFNSPQLTGAFPEVTNEASKIEE